MKHMMMNPVLNKEFMLRFRSPKSFLGLLFYLLAIALIIVGFIFIQSMTSLQGFFKPNQSRELFMIMSFMQLALILFITPGLTAGVISSERERQTLNILLTTTQSSTSIIMSKLVSSVSYLLLLIIASLPLYSIVFLYGGISPGQVLQNLALYMFTIIVYGAVGVLLSTLIRKTIVSIVTAYGVTLFLAGGTAFITLILTSYIQGIPGNTPAVNPAPYFAAMLNPPIILFSLMQPDYMEEFSRMTGIEFPLWGSFLISYIILFFAAIVWSIKKLRPNMK
ncbi:ABC transporter permease [Bacillus benzoevorans]|uniref:ABC-type transport system involved in multi-copper enzyme maturation permease subunit n=1 Tax=Bacillus benzoevorans TaxID=1456 RepID=A0A7X0HN31_9BACI|nr:ABC transporter permease [Bacillus benzoevorans]MBB6443809.1 ABC-type transport system involved in multi-copper enzyme maturation permease subunit [Bacillus benzoevorans]